MTSTEERRTAAVQTPDGGAALGPTRTTVTLGPFLVALTEQDVLDRRPTVAVALAYLAPADAANAAGAAARVQARLRELLRVGIPLTGLQQVAEAFYAGMAAPGRAGGPVEHGVRITQVAVSLLPRDVTSGQLQPVATVCVADQEITATGSA